MPPRVKVRIRKKDREHFPALHVYFTIINIYPHIFSHIYTPIINYFRFEFIISRFDAEKSSAIFDQVILNDTASLILGLSYIH